MLSTIPKGQLLIGWDDVFKNGVPDSRINLIRHGCKTVLLGELAALNFRLKSNKTIYQDTSLETQRKILGYLAGGNDNYFNYYLSLIGKYLQFESKYGIFISRATCLYAIEEILQSDLEVKEGFTMKEFWPELFKYILAVNKELTKLKNDETLYFEESKKQTANSLEKLNPELLPLNEIAINTNSFYTTIRGFNLLKYLSEHPQTGSHLKKYLLQYYEFEYDRFVYELMRLYLSNNKNGENDFLNEVTGEKIDTTFFYKIKDKSILPFFESLSSHFVSKNIERLISVKKFPLYKSSEDTFLLLDNILALEKCYYQFINDFWFDSISLIKNKDGKQEIPIKSYRSIIGYFLETYIESTFRNVFSQKKHWPLKLFNELFAQKEGKQIELADIYLRKNNMIFIAQVKATGIYDNEKFAGDLEGFYKQGRDAFFSSFGLYQIIESIKNVELVSEKIDIKFPKGHFYRIYPAIIVNEKAMQTPIMAQLFNERFNELLHPFRSNQIHIHPLSIIHISDLEQMEEKLISDPEIFWKTIAYNIREPKYIPPFYNTLSRLQINPNYSKAQTLFTHLIDKFNPAV